MHRRILSIAPALLDRISPGIEIGYTQEDVQRGIESNGARHGPDLLPKGFCGASPTAPEITVITDCPTALLMNPLYACVNGAKRHSASEHGIGRVRSFLSLISPWPEQLLRLPRWPRKCFLSEMQVRVGSRVEVRVESSSV